MHPATHDPILAKEAERLSSQSLGLFGIGAVFAGLSAFPKSKWTRFYFAAMALMFGGMGGEVSGSYKIMKERSYWKRWVNTHGYCHDDILECCEAALCSRRDRASPSNDQ